MNKTGTYALIPGQGIVKISDDVPKIYGNDVIMPKGDLPYYDKSYRMRFESKAHKRAILKADGMKEAGIITNPDKRWDRPAKNATKRAIKSNPNETQAQEWVKSHGGALGLLDRLNRGGK